MTATERARERIGDTRLCGTCGRLIREWITDEGRTWRHVVVGIDHEPDLRPMDGHGWTESEMRGAWGDR